MTTPQGPQPMDLFSLPAHRLEEIAETLYAFSAPRDTLSPIRRQPSAGPSNPNHNLREHRAPEPSLPPQETSAPAKKWTAYPVPSPTPEPQRSGPADARDLARATNSIRLLYEHDKGLIDSVNKLRERTVFMREKAAELKKTLAAQKGIRGRLESYIKYWRPIGDHWLPSDYYGDKPFRASYKDGHIRILADDESSDEDEPLSPSAVPTLVRNPRGVSTGIPNPESQRPDGRLKVSKHKPAFSPKVNSTAPPNTPFAGPVSSTLPNESSPGPLAGASLFGAHAPRFAPTADPSSLFNSPPPPKAIGKRRRSSSPKETSLLDSPSPKRRQIATHPPPSSSRAIRTASLEDALERESIALMLTSVGDEFEDQTASMSAPTETAGRIFTPADENHPLPAIVPADAVAIFDRGGEMMAADKELDDVLAPLPSVVRSERGPVEGDAQALPQSISRPPSRSRRQRSASAQPTRRSLRANSKGVN